MKIFKIITFIIVLIVFIFDLYTHHILNSQLGIKGGISYWIYLFVGLGLLGIILSIGDSDSPGFKAVFIIIAVFLLLSFVPSIIMDMIKGEDFFTAYTVSVTNKMTPFWLKILRLFTGK
ncbi:MAG: hypothetical protein KBA47_02380 [Caldisericia bacterium]|nr:hypothetical protein [Caldisericia bacterium]